ncbi:phosphotransferase family protein [Rhodococcus sp. SGAir0479]|uniref:phosphotransferase family protein n=1 Tax=Rhodococcus sp. SGAir0479 TaxID=2567884 RepID=UPI0010CD47D8|nr:phosphotransferase family protein [Rhodococcus sp. SGAir0479]QCQ92634.1 phosphotransferase family protein [Rhodococcus sp. SGAir0479]
MTTTHLDGLDLVALQRFFEDRGVSTAGELRARLISGGKSNLTFEVFDDVSRWVLRRPPTAGLTPSAHDVAREYRVCAALQGSAVPVAPTVALCEDESVMGAPFAVTGFVEGRVIRTVDDLDRLSDAEIDASVEELVRVLAALHAVDHRAVGLEAFGRPDGYLSRQVALWARQWERVKTRDLPDLERLHARLQDAVPTASQVAIVHGDYRIDNTLVADDDPGRVVAVVDWELSTLGDPLADLAQMCVYRHPALDVILGEPAAWTSERLPSAEAIAQQYSTVTGRNLGHWGFYLGLANFKLAVIAEGITHRHRAGATTGEGFAHACEAVPPLVAAGLAATEGDR